MCSLSSEVDVTRWEKLVSRGQAATTSRCLEHDAFASNPGSTTSWLSSSLSLGFFFCKMGIIMVLVSASCRENGTREH